MKTIICRVETRNRGQQRLKAELKPGEIHLIAAVPDDVLVSVTAQVNVPTAIGEKIFMNGYQTWTACPEYSRSDLIHGLSRLPRAIVRAYSLDRYGDYHFVDYPEQPGITHGVSWCYFRKGEQFRLLASLDERPGYTLFNYDSVSGTLVLRRDCENVNCSGELHAFDLFYAEGTEDEVFDAWFAAMNIHPRTDMRLAGYSSWYNRYQNIDSASVTADLKGCEGVLEPGDLFQVDDGWEPFVGDWLEPDKKKFPEGMKAVSDAIHAKGYLSGLWLAPFVAEKKSTLFKTHPDWFLHVDGKPWAAGCNWSGSYGLDIDNPAVVKYLEQVFDRVLNDWGFDLVKLDFLYAAAPYGSVDESRAARMTRALELLRRLCGNKLILGCGVPVMPAFGLVDYCRVSCDVGLDWNDNRLMQLAHRERVSTKQAIGNTISRRELNGRAYLSDPDVFFLRENNLKLTAREKTVLSEVNSLLGGVLLTSDNPADYKPQTLETYRHLRHLRDAKNVQVHAGDSISITYELDGEPHELVIPDYN